MEQCVYTPAQTSTRTHFTQAVAELLPVSHRYTPSRRALCFLLTASLLSKGCSEDKLRATANQATNCARRLLQTSKTSSSKMSSILFLLLTVRQKSQPTKLFPILNCKKRKHGNTLLI